MTYPEAIYFLFNSLPVWERKGAGAYKPGLERISAFAAALGGNGRGELIFPTGHSPHTKFVHVAGTNGKGSTCHMLAAVLQSTGYRTGLFTSPHLVDFRERIRVDGCVIPEEAVVEFTECWHEEMVRHGLTFFEMSTAMALWWFERAGCDFAVIEVGLGGRLDSTNIITPVVSVITNIGLEHTQYLGDTIAQIAAEKAGIIKPGVPMVVGETDPESEPVFRARVAEMGSEIIFADKAPDYELDLAGDYQQNNLATVLATVGILRRTLTIPDGTLREGLAHTAALTGLRGRWQVVRRNPLVVLDTAHNAHGIAGVMRQIARQKYDKLFMVLGFAGDKDLSAIIPLLPREAHYILTQADTPRAMPVEKIVESEKWKEENELHDKNSALAPLSSFHFSLSTEKTVPSAVRRALSLAGQNDMVFIGGSNFVVGEAIQALEMLKTGQ